MHFIAPSVIWNIASSSNNMERQRVDISKLQEQYSQILNLQARLDNFAAKSKGDQGQQGIQGSQGSKGEAGLQGQAGPQGPKGDQGPQGTQGLQGIPGRDSEPVPGGAVVAFDTAEGCPAGWAIFYRGVGRSLIGAGKNKNVDADGNKISSYDPGTTGGVEFHQISKDEMPTQHFRIFYKRSQVKLETGDDFIVRYIVSDPKSTGIGDAEIPGSNKPFSTVPPYAAVVFCKKKF